MRLIQKSQLFSEDFLNRYMAVCTDHFKETEVDTSDVEADGESSQEIDRLSNNFIKITNMAQLHCNSHMMQTVKQFNDRLENIETPSQLLSLFGSNLATKHGNRKKN